MLTKITSVLLLLLAVTFGDAHADVRGPDEQRATPDNFVDAQNSLFGKQTTFRATHAKGMVLLGKFTPNSDAAKLSVAPHFRQSVSITVRFSDNTGIPMLPDGAPLATPHGMALKFHLADGSETDLVTHSFNGFPAANADDMRQFFLAVGASGPGVATPTPLDQLMAKKPVVKAFLTSQDPPPVSYATLAYFGVNSFKFTNAAGVSTYARYQILPMAGRHFLSKAQEKDAPPAYLSDELRSRIAKGPLRFRLVLQLAAPTDKIDDPSVAWSETNKRVEIGTIEIGRFVPDSAQTERALLFLPGLLPAGIEPADPMIDFRDRTYPVSYERRHRR